MSSKIIEESKKYFLSSSYC